MDKFERSVDQGPALEIALSFAENNGIKLEYDSVGSFLKTSSCTLRDSKGKISEGRGKGLASQSLLSAIFEAIEHYFYGAENLGDSNLLEINLNSHDSDLADCSPDFNLICSDASVVLNRLKFLQIDSRKSVLLYPAVLTNPNYEPVDVNEKKVIADYRFTRYATNSGTASGLTESDSILHGLLETIERDSIGIELLRTVIRQKAYPVRKISIDSLPPALKEIVSLAEMESKGSIALWNITSDIGVPAILCGISISGKERFSYFGSGASIWVDYAIERALLEAIQGFHIQTILKIIIQQPMTRDENRITRYQRCNLDEGYFLYRGGIEMTRYDDISSPCIAGEKISSEMQINIILDALARLNMKAYYRNILEKEVFVSQVVVPGLERFYLVSHGIPVAPSYRGRKVLLT